MKSVKPFKKKTTVVIICPLVLNHKQTTQANNTNKLAKMLEVS